MYRLQLRQNKKQSNLYALIDDEDVIPVLEQGQWFLSKHCPYPACVLADQKTVRLHRFLLNVTDEGLSVDHIDGDPMNNQKSNLRLATKSENARNRFKHADKVLSQEALSKRIVRQTVSRYKGVSTLVLSDSWRAYISPHGKQIHLGTFATEEEAAHAYNLAAIKYFGEFANLNDVPEVPLNPITNRHAGASGYVGVRVTPQGTFFARAKIKGVEHSIGIFDTAEEARDARALWVEERNKPKRVSFKFPIRAIIAQPKNI